MNSKMKKLALIALLGATSLVATQAEDVASGKEGFDKLYTIFLTWMGGSLGKVLGLIGFAGTFIAYMMTHKGQVLFVGIIISLIAGAIPGIAELFFNAGSQTFTATAP